MKHRKIVALGLCLLIPFAQAEASLNEQGKAFAAEGAQKSVRFAEQEEAVPDETEGSAAVPALEPGTQAAALCEYAVRQSEALMAARLSDSGLSDELGRLDAETSRRLAALEGAKPDYAALLLPSENFDRDAILERNGFDETMVPTVAFELVRAANRRYGDDAFADWSDRYSLYGVYDGDAPELAYAELIYGKDAPQTVTVFVRLANGVCLTRTSFADNPSASPEPTYITLPELADSFWEDLDTQLWALLDE